MRFRVIIVLIFTGDSFAVQDSTGETFSIADPKEAWLREVLQTRAGKFRLENLKTE